IMCARLEPDEICSLTGRHSCKYLQTNKTIQDYTGMHTHSTHTHTHAYTEEFTQCIKARWNKGEYKHRDLKSQGGTYTNTHTQAHTHTHTHTHTRTHTQTHTHTHTHTSTQAHT